MGLASSQVIITVLAGTNLYGKLPHSYPEKKNEQDVNPNSLYLWWRIRDLNPGPTDYDSAALTTELIRHRVFKRGRILPLDKFSVKFSRIYTMYLLEKENYNLKYKSFFAQFVLLIFFYLKLNFVINMPYHY